MPSPPPFAADIKEMLDLSGFGAVIFTCGYRPGYTSWVSFPEAFDDLGFPIQENGPSTTVSGLRFMGVHFQRERKSATFLGVAEDAAVLAETLAASNRST
jgi:putative flavoprotein involved in K+ transport